MVEQLRQTGLVLREASICSAHVGWVGNTIRTLAVRGMHSSGSCGGVYNLYHARVIYDAFKIK